MSEENVEIAVGYFEATDFGKATDLLADDVTFVFHGEARHLAGAGTISGAVPISRQTAQVMTVAHGKIVRQEFFSSRDAVLEVAGPSE